MSLLVECRITSDQLSLPDVAAAVPELELTVEEWRSDEPGRLDVFVVANGRRHDRFETLLEDTEQVDTLETIAATDLRRLYRVGLESEFGRLPSRAAIDGIITSIRIEPEGLYATGYFADRAAVKTMSEGVTDHGFSIEILRLCEASDGDSELPFPDKQFEALATAYRMGYFDVPRRSTQADVAARLGISTQSLGERLTRANHRLIEQHVFRDGEQRRVQG